MHVYSFSCRVVELMLNEADTVYLDLIRFYYLDLLLFTVFVCLFHSFNTSLSPFFSYLISSIRLSLAINFSNLVCVQCTHRF